MAFDAAVPEGMPRVSGVLTIVGASVRAAACSAVRAGCTVYAGDQFGDVDLRRACCATKVSRYPAGLVAVLESSPSDAWMYTGALENSPALVDRMARIRPLWGNSAERLRRVRHPALLARALDRGGLLYPPLSLQPERLPRNGSWLRKPRHSAGGLRIAPWDLHARQSHDSRGFYFQQRIDGDACSAVYLAAAGNAVLLGATRQLIGAAWTGTTGFCYCGSVGPMALSPHERANFTEIGAVLAREFDLQGLFGVDAILNPRGAWVVEVNPRYTASVELLEWAFDIRAISLHGAACETGSLPPAAPLVPIRSCGKAILFAPHRLVIPPEWAPRDSMASDLAWPLLADVPAPGSTIEAGGPVLTILAEGPAEPDVLELLKSRAADLQPVFVGWRRPE